MKPGDEPDQAAERRRLWHAVNSLLDGVTDVQVRGRLNTAGSEATLAHAFRLGISAALMEIARQPEVKP